MKPIGVYVAARELPGRDVIGNGVDPAAVRTLRATDRLTGMPVLVHVLPNSTTSAALPVPQLPDHPALLPYADEGMDGDDAYLVTELPLHAVLAADPVLAARGALAGLAALHGAGLVHGGVSASQLWSVDGRVALAGAGLPWGAGPGSPDDDLRALADALAQLGGVPEPLRPLQDAPGTLTAEAALARLQAGAAAGGLSSSGQPAAIPVQSVPTEAAANEQNPPAAPHDGSPIILGESALQKSAPQSPTVGPVSGPLVDQSWSKVEVPVVDVPVVEVARVDVAFTPVPDVPARQDEPLEAVRIDPAGSSSESRSPKPSNTAPSRPAPSRPAPSGTQAEARPPSLVAPVAIQPVAIQPVAIQPVSIQPVAIQPVAIQIDLTQPDPAHSSQPNPDAPDSAVTNKAAANTPLSNTAVTDTAVTITPIRPPAQPEPLNVPAVSPVSAYSNAPPGVAETPQERRKRQNDERRAQAMQDSRAAAERKAAARREREAAQPAVVQIEFDDLPELPGKDSEAPPPVGMRFPASVNVERVPASMRRAPLPPEELEEPQQKPVQEVGRLPARRTQGEPIRIGWAEDDSWRVVKAPGQAAPARPSAPRWLLPLLAALLLIGGAVWAYFGWSDSKAPAAAAESGPCCTVRFTVQGAAGVTARLTVLEAPDGANLTPGQEVGVAPGPINLPVRGTYRLRVAADGYAPATLSVTAPAPQPLRIDLGP
jgi:hypothetical protein